MAGLLPPSMRCSAYWYAQNRGLPVSIGYLKSLGLIAARMAYREGLAPWQVPEGPYLVHQWPEHIWDAASVQPQVREAEFWCCQPPPEDTQAYDDWSQMADEGWRDEIPRGSYPGWANPYD